MLLINFCALAPFLFSTNTIGDDQKPGGGKGKYVSKSGKKKTCVPVLETRKKAGGIIFSSGFGEQGVRGALNHLSASGVGPFPPPDDSAQVPLLCWSHKKGGGGMENRHKNRDSVSFAPERKEKWVLHRNFSPTLLIES